MEVGIITIIDGKRYRPCGGTLDPMSHRCDTCFAPGDPARGYCQKLEPMEDAPDGESEV